jgi:hypothetical protein
MVGILFAQPNSFTKEEIFSNIDYYNNRSAKNIDFFCVGYKPDFYDKSLPVQVQVDGKGWVFDPMLFNTLREEIEQVCYWRYSGGVELVLFDAFFEAEEQCKVRFDFSNTLVLNLRKAKDDKLIDSVGELFEKIFRLAENIDQNSPTQKASLHLIGGVGKESIVSILFKLLPQSVQQEVGKIFLFGTNDLTEPQILL